MSITVRKLNPRKRSKRDLAHKPNGHGIRQWHSRSVLWRWYRKNRRKRQAARLQRRRNRA